MAAQVDEIFKKLDEKSEQFKTLQYRTAYLDRDDNIIPGSESVTRMIRMNGRVLINHAAKIAMKDQTLEVEALITPAGTYTKKKAGEFTQYDQNSTSSSVYVGMVCHGMVLNDNANFTYTVLPDEEERGMAMWVVEGIAKKKSANPATPARVVWKFDKKSGLIVRTEAFNSENARILRGRVHDIRIDEELNEAIFNPERFREKQ
jgi:hypothetical protein